MEQIKTIQVGENTYTIGAEQEKTDSAPVLKREKINKKFKADGWDYPESATIVRPNILYEIVSNGENVHPGMYFIPQEYYNQSGTLYVTNGGYGIFHENDSEIEGYPYKLFLVDNSIESGCEVFFSYNPTISEYTDGCSIKIRNISKFASTPYDLREIQPNDYILPTAFFGPELFYKEYNKILFISQMYTVVKIEPSDNPEYLYKIETLTAPNETFTYYLSSLDDGLVTCYNPEDGVWVDSCAGAMDANFEISDPNTVSRYYIHGDNIDMNNITFAPQCNYGQSWDIYDNFLLESLVSYKIASFDIEIKDCVTTLVDFSIIT